MSDDFGTNLLEDDFEKTPSISFRDAKVGQKLVLRIAELPSRKIQRKDFTTKEPLFWPLRSGETEKKPKLNTFTKFVVLEGSDEWTKNAERDDMDPAHEIDGAYNWWCNLPSQGWVEFRLKNKLLGQEPGDPKNYKQKFGTRKGEEIVLDKKYDKFRAGLGRGFVVGDVIELKYASKKILDGDSSPQKIYEIRWLRNEAPAAPSVFDDADDE